MPRSVWRSVACSAQRNGAVLVWLPVFLAFPLLDLAGEPLTMAAQLGLLVVVAGCTLAAVLPGPPRAGSGARGWQYAAWAALALAPLLATGWGDGWHPLWWLATIVAPVVLRGRWLAGAVALLAAGAGLTSWLDGRDLIWVSIGGLLLTAATTTSFLRLLETIGQLRHTQQELARVAVAEERERFSRDLHDLLGHTLSVMVVKAEAVRRLVADHPEQAVAHAADIERVGREALVEVRQAVDGMRTASLAEALEQARQALDSAQISTHVDADPTPLPARSEEALAWVVREATTNVLRHSGADSCRIEVRAEGGRARLTVTDDGVGGPVATSDRRRGGLEGLRRRLESADGDLAVEPGPDGFRLVARVPGTAP